MLAGREAAVRRERWDFLPPAVPVLLGGVEGGCGTKRPPKGPLGGPLPGPPLPAPPDAALSGEWASGGEGVADRGEPWPGGASPSQQPRCGAGMCSRGRWARGAVGCGGEVGGVGFLGTKRAKSAPGGSVGAVPASES